MTADPVPMLCRACGAPAEARGEVALVCTHCGGADELPREAHARVRELRRRLRARAAGVVQLSERDATLARIFEGQAAGRSTLAVYAGLAAMSGVTALGPLLSGHGSLSGVVMSLGNALPLLAFPCAALASLAIGRSIYHRGIREQLHALPSRAPGGPARCRCCGAELPREHGPLLRCRHCRTYSLVTPALLARAAEALAGEVQVQRENLARASSQVVDIGRAMDRIFYGAMPMMFVVALLGALVLQRLLGR